jgi:hypothetical protein
LTITTTSEFFTWIAESVGAQTGVVGVGPAEGFQAWF